MQKLCSSRACGASRWHCIANVYNGTAILAYVNGAFDAMGSSKSSSSSGSSSSSSSSNDNPFLYPHPPAFPNGGIHTPPYGTAAPLALGAKCVHLGGGTGRATLANMFVGRVGGFAVANRALSAEEVARPCYAVRGCAFGVTRHSSTIRTLHYGTRERTRHNILAITCWF